MENSRRSFSVEETFGRFEKALTGLTFFRKQALSPSNIPFDGAGNREQREDLKGPLGLNLLYAVEDPLVDFIFVHGLGGGSRKSWSKTSDLFHYWPKEWLSRDPEFSCVRAHSFGYKADWNEKKAGVLNIHEFALSLLADIRCNPDIRRSKTKIVLIAHSMGGIVVKKAYILAREDPALKELAARIHTLYFLATPHRGSDLAKTLTNILKISYEQKNFVLDLERNSESITSINDSFRHSAGDLELWSFYETIPSNLVFSNAIIVDRGSATLGYPGERHAPLNADHRGVCKFEPTDSNYKTLRNAFITTIDTILSEVTQETSETAKLQHSRLVELTGVAESPVDDLTSLEDVRVDGSCEWLTSKAPYAYWRDDSAPSKPIFWLAGNAGSGKSVLCSQVINNLQSLNQRHSYFFFKHGNATKYTIASCLLSLAYQMARTDNGILDKLVEFQRDAGSWEHWEDRTIWRRLFIGVIFNSLNRQPHFWVIDALDECQKPTAFLELLAKAPSYLRVFVTSRNSPHVEQGLNALSRVIERYEVGKEDIRGDLDIFIRSKMDFLPVDDDESRNRLREKILEKSSGSFLWVSLIVQELEQVYSDESAEEVLEDVPPDMNSLYSRMLGNIANNGRARDLAKSIFTWTLLTPRALTLGELQCALKLDISQTVHNLRKSIAAICGQLIWVDHNNLIQYVHQTARTFLIHQDTNSYFIISKQQGHTRIAEVCLRYLIGNLKTELRARGAKASLLVSSANLEFIAYACVHFSDHVQKCLSEDSRVWQLLCRFLKANVPHWIEYLARSGILHHIYRTAKNLKTYLARRAKYLAPVFPDVEKLESWIDDLIRVSARFRTCLTVCPSAIHSVVPALCPSNSMVYRTYAASRPGMLVRGATDETWDECLTRIVFPTRTTAVTYGDRYLAVAAANGSIWVYHGDSIQSSFTLSQGEMVRILTFSCGDQYLASSGSRRIKVWDTESKVQLWEFKTRHDVLSFVFVNDDAALMAATTGNFTVAWDMTEGEEVEKRMWTHLINESGGHKRPNRAPASVSFSQDRTILAVSYRGLPLHLFDLTTELFIGHCSKTPGARRNHCAIDVMTFNPSPEINVVVVSYGDGELVLFDLWSTELCHQIHDVYANSLACSPNGRTLITGSSSGIVQIFEFGGAEGHNLTLIYQVNTYEAGIHAMAFDSDSRRFADIQTSQCRVWEPAVLVCNDLGEGSQSELSNAVPLSPKALEFSAPNKETVITAVCCHPTGDIIFCGKEDGSVISFDTHKATQDRVLYRHARHVRITCISYSVKRDLIISADDISRILIKTVEISNSRCVITGDVADIRTDIMVTRLVPNVSSTRLLLQSRTSASVWTMNGEETGFSFNFNSDIRNNSLSNHPLDPDYFIFIDHSDMKVFPWVSTPKLETSKNDTGNTTLDPSTTATSALSDLRLQQQNNTQYVAFFYANRSTFAVNPASNVFMIWDASCLPASHLPASVVALPAFEKLKYKVRRLISIVGSFIYFLDTDLWVCSMDIRESTSSSHGAKRHFVLLQEWQRSDGSFLIEHVASTNDFVVVRKQGAVVIKRGLDFAEPWFP